MNDKIIGRIDHTECKHPHTSHEMKKCRAKKIEQARARQNRTKVEKFAGSGRVESMLEKEARASAALDRGDGQTRSVGEVTVPSGPDLEVSLVSTRNGKRVIALDNIEWLHSATVELSEALSHFGDVLNAEVRMDIDDVGEVIFAYGEELEGWGVVLP
jgi:hypothetical protein